MGTPATQRKFGPDDNRAINRSSLFTHVVPVPAGMRVRFRASTDALDENVLVIYRIDPQDGHPIPRPVLEYGNGQRAGRKRVLDSPIAGPRQRIGYLVTGWHKTVSPGDPLAPLHKWKQSRVRVRALPNGRGTEIGFEDSGGTGDYNDSLCKAELLNPPRTSPAKKK